MTPSITAHKFSLSPPRTEHAEWGNSTRSSFPDSLHVAFDMPRPCFAPCRYGNTALFTGFLIPGSHLKNGSISTRCSHPFAVSFRGHPRLLGSRTTATRPSHEASLTWSHFLKKKVFSTLALSLPHKPGENSKTLFTRHVLESSFASISSFYYNQLGASMEPLY